MPYSLRRTGSTDFEIVRNRRVIITCRGRREFAELERRRFENDEAASKRAIRSGDPLTLCRLGWHRLGFGSGMPLKVRSEAGFSDVPFFQFAARIGEAGGTLVFQVADQPFLHAARSVKTLGNLKPWRCAACGEEIPPETTGARA